MARFGQQHAWMLQLQQRISQAAPRWLRNRLVTRVTTMEVTGSIAQLSAQQMEQVQPDGAPEVFAQLRDDELLALMAQGDPQALGAFYDRYSGLVYSVALHITDEQRGAEAVTQDVFRIVWQYAHIFRGGTGAASGWIVGIARRSALDTIGCQQGPTSCPRTISPAASRGAMLQAEVDLARAAGFQDDVRAALAALPAGQRQAIELAYYGGLTTPVIGAVLGMPEDQVKAHLRLGLATLRNALLPVLEVGQRKLVEDDYDGTENVAP
ncbi:MAG: sigma-70 family RNA polymerase sigma factor [Chloroflexota bacterium]|nr:sigma-70 family RNA polymerase sigma factor [Chloroflexota bacterium]